MAFLKIHNPIPKAFSKEDLAQALTVLQEMYKEASSGTSAPRKEIYGLMASQYYSMATDFYEYGWGPSFHFAPRRKGETFEESITNHERFIAQSLGFAPGMKVLDIGCGIGGPMREMAKTSGADIVGLNINEYQLDKCKAYNEQAGLADRCRLVHGDYMDIPEQDGHFDAAYAIESIPYTSDKIGAFSEVLRVLKPGGVFGCYEYCLTPEFDADNAEHQRIKRGIEETTVSFTVPTDVITNALEAVGFEVIEARDVALEADPQTPWYRPLEGRDLGLSLKSLPRTSIGRKITGISVALLERLSIIPKGISEISQFLNLSADYFVEAGHLGIMTPAYYCKVRKPNN